MSKIIEILSVSETARVIMAVILLLYVVGAAIDIKDLWTRSKNRL